MDRHGKRGRDSLEGDPARRDDKRLRHDGAGFAEGGLRGGMGTSFQHRGGSFGGFHGHGRFGGAFQGEPAGMAQQMRPPMAAGSMAGPLPGGMPGPGMSSMQPGMPMMGRPGHMMGGPQGLMGTMPGPAGGPGMQLNMPGMPGPMMQQPVVRQQPGPGGAPGPAFAPQHAKFEDIKLKRRESHAALLRRQVANLELSPTLTRAPLYEKYQAMKQAATEGKPVGGTLASSSASRSSFAAIDGVRRCYMYEAVSSAQEMLVMPTLPVGYDPHAGLDAAMQLYEEQKQKGQLLTSKFGSFAVTPEVAAFLGEERT